MQHIAIETAYFCEIHGPQYETFNCYPWTPKGLALAVVAVERLMSTIDDGQVHSDINIKFCDQPELEIGKNLDDDKLFELVGRHKAGFSIMKDCKQVFEDRARHRAHTMEKVIRAAVEDLIKAGFALTVDDGTEGEQSREVELIIDELCNNLFNEHVDCHVTAYRDDLEPAVFSVEDDGSDNPIGSNSVSLSPFLKRAERIALVA